MRRTPLTDLEPKFLRYHRGKDGRVYYVGVSTIDEAQGVEFLCPKCFEENLGPIGTHMVVCWSAERGVPDDAEPGPGRWRLEGKGLSDLTLAPEPPKRARSVKLTSGCQWHGFITDGMVT